MYVISIGKHRSGHSIQMISNEMNHVKCQAFLFKEIKQITNFSYFCVHKLVVNLIFISYVRLIFFTTVY